MENLLQLASRLANIQDYTSDDDSYNTKLTCNQRNYISDLSPAPTNEVTAYTSSSPLNQDNVSNFGYHQDQSFELFLNDTSQSPILSQSVTTDLPFVIDDLIQSKNTLLFSSPEIASPNSINTSLQSTPETTLDNPSNISSYSGSTNTSLQSTPERTSGNTSSISSDSGLYGVNDEATNPVLEAAKAEHKRPELSYVEMIAKCILASKSGKVALCEIYDFILKEYPYFETALPAWRISVRHHLSTCESFIKVGRVPLSRGFYWAIHDACKEDFEKGIFDRKLMRQRIGNLKPRKRTRKTTKEKVKSINDSKPAQATLTTNTESPYIPTTRTNEPIYQNSISKISQHPPAVYPDYMNHSGNNVVYNRLSDLSEPRNVTPACSYTNTNSEQYYHDQVQEYCHYNNTNNNYYGAHLTQNLNYGYNNGYSGYQNVYQQVHNPVNVSSYSGQLSNTYDNYVPSSYGKYTSNNMIKYNGPRYTPY